MLRDILARIERRLEATGLSAAAASKQAGLSLDAIRNLRRAVESDGDGRSGVSTATLIALAPILGTTASWLLEGVGPEGAVMVPLIGSVGMTPDGVVSLYGPHSGARELVAAPPGLSGEGVAALVVRGHALRGVAESGALIYFEKVEDPDELLGSPVVAQMVDGPVVVGRLLRGPAPGLYDLEPLSGPSMSARLAWVGSIAATLQPSLADRVARMDDPDVTEGVGIKVFGS